MAHRKNNKDIYTVGRTLSSGVPGRAVNLPAQPVSAVPARTSGRKAAWKKALVLLLLALIIFPILIGLWNYRNYSAASEKLFGSGNLLGALGGANLKGAERERVNILVVGYSADDPGHAGANLTDSIMIVSLSTVNQTGYMLSIPRDLYVPIQGYGRAKINEAYQHGEISEFALAGYSQGGIGMLEKTIHDTLGIQTDYYALVNYAAVRDITNALGGITVNIQSSDPRGIYDPNFKPQEGGPLKLPSGPQKIDGPTALRLTRARGATYGSYGLAQSDFDRTKNQQAVLAGIKNSVSWNILLDPRKNEPFLDAASSNVRTNVELSEALPLFRLFRSIPEQNMTSATLRDIKGVNLLAGYQTQSGQAALIPAAGVTNFSQIRSTINSLNQ